MLLEQVLQQIICSCITSAETQPLEQILRLPVLVESKLKIATYGFETNLHRNDYCLVLALLITHLRWPSKLLLEI